MHRGRGAEGAPLLRSAAGHEDRSRLRPRSGQSTGRPRRGPGPAAPPRQPPASGSPGLGRVGFAAFGRAPGVGSHPAGRKPFASQPLVWPCPPGPTRRPGVIPGQGANGPFLRNSFPKPAISFPGRIWQRGLTWGSANSRQPRSRRGVWGCGACGVPIRARPTIVALS